MTDHLVDANKKVLTEEEIISMAVSVLSDFAKYVIAHEREACAKICDSVDNYANPMTASDCADAIRARGDA